MKRNATYPGFWQAVLLCVIFVAVQIGFVLPITLLESVLRVDLVRHPAVIGLDNLAAWLAVLMTAWFWAGRPAWSTVYPLRQMSVKTFSGVILSSLGAIIVLSEIDNLVRLALPAPDWLLKLFHDLSSHRGGIWEPVFLLVIVAPLTEETLFRGLILQGFLGRFRPVSALVLSAMLFGAVHLNPWQFVSAGLLGILFAWWFYRTRSLVPSLLGHALVNGSAVAHNWLPFEIQGFNQGESMGNPLFQPFWFDLLGTGLLAIGTGLFWFGSGSGQIQPESAPETLLPPDAPPVISNAPGVKPENATK